MPAGDFDWTRYAVGGAARPDTFSGMDPAFASALQQLFVAAPADIQPHLRVTSGFRSNDVQAGLWADALKKYGSPEAARKWVAPPGSSNHNHGHAADLKYLNDAARSWAHANAGNFGLAFPLSNEDWHIELAGRRGGGSGAAGNPTAAAEPVANGSQKPAPSLGEIVAPKPVERPAFGSVIATMLAQQSQIQEAQAEAAAAEKARRQALFGG